MNLLFKMFLKWKARLRIISFFSATIISVFKSLSSFLSCAVRDNQTGWDGIKPLATISTFVVGGGVVVSSSMIVTLSVVCGAGCINTTTESETGYFARR